MSTPWTPDPRPVVRLSKDEWRALLREANREATEAHRAARRAKAREYAEAKKRRQSASEGT